MKDDKIAKELENTYEIVKNILKTKPDTRSSDTLLLAYVQKICKDNDFAPISTETITRTRRKIQNTEGLYPASKEVQERRRIKEEEYKGKFREEREKRIEERIKEIIKMAQKLGWLEKTADTYPKIQLSEIEICMSAMVNNFDLERMRKWVEERHD